MYLTIIILPLLGSIVAGFFGRKVGVRGAQIITCSCVIVTTILALLAWVEVAFNNIPVTIYLFRWIDSEWFNITWGFYFDALTVSMLIPVLIISSLVHIYSIGYMSADPHQQRFFSYLSLFTFMMIILVTGNNYLLMFVGWEGVGVCSYLLVSFWYTRIAANQSSISAFLTNRVGDCFLTIGMFTILWSMGTLDYATVFSLAPYINENVITIIGICLVIGAMAKSSQVGQMKALKKLWFNSDFFRTLIYAGNISNTSESVGPDNMSDPEKSQGQGIYQQGTNGKIFNKEFLQWFIGFAEGDGCFYITRGKSIFSIHLHIVDLPLLIEIKTQLNMGSIYIGKKSCLLTIKAKKETETLINIFNGKIYLSKRKIQFNKWAQNFEQNYSPCNHVNLQPSTYKPSLSDNWLAGFIDAEGSFLVSVSKEKIIQRIVIGQKDAELEFNYLSNLLNGYTEKLKGHNRLVINYSNLSRIICYLNNHKLYSIKAKSYDKWLDIYNMRKNRNKLEKIDYVFIKKKASLINSLRKILT